MTKAIICDALKSEIVYRGETPRIGESLRVTVDITDVHDSDDEEGVSINHTQIFTRILV